MMWCLKMSFPRRRESRNEATSSLLEGMDPRLREDDSVLGDNKSLLGTIKHSIKSIFILLTITLSMISAVNTASANTPAFTCTTLPTVDASGYLADETAFGYVQNNISMDFTGACDVGTDNLIFSAKAGALWNTITMAANTTKKISDLGVATLDMNSVNIIKDIEVSAEIIDDKLCLTMPTSRGAMPLICRNVDPDSALLAPDPDDTCSVTGSACSGVSRSQSLVNFSGRSVDCLQETLDRVFHGGGECDTSPNAITPLRSFAEFMDAFKVAIGAALIIYTMFFGFKLMLNKDQASLEKISMFVLKMLLVIYFTVGMGQTTIKNGVEYRENGMTQLVLPILNSATTEFAEFVFNAAGSPGLCQFDRDSYDAGYEYYSMWDALDCRLAYYFGQQVMYDMDASFHSLSRTAGPGGGTPVTWEQAADVDVQDEVERRNSDGLMYFSVIMGFIFGGQILVAIIGIIFGLIFMGIRFYFLSVYLVCMVTLYVMVYISPIFIPMVLFKKTKMYFDAWLRIVTSVVLQPAIIAGFIALLVTVYDNVYYGSCEFQRWDYETADAKFNTYEIRTPSADVLSCTDSVGYKMTEHFRGKGWEQKNFTIFSYFIIGGGGGELLLSMISMIMFVIIFYFILKQVSEFAAGITGGPSVGGVTANPTGTIDKVIAGGAAVVALGKAAVKAKSGDSQGAKEDLKEAGEKSREATTDKDDNKQESGDSKATAGSEVKDAAPKAEKDGGKK